MTDPGTGGGPGDAGMDGSAGPGTLSRTPRVVSVAPSYLVVGDSYSYAPKTNTRTRSLEMVGAPTGMSLDKGMVRWSPSETQAGNYHVTLRATGAGSAAGAVAEQPLNISVVKATLRAEGDVSEEGGSVHAQSPAAKRLLGLGVSVPPRSLTKPGHMTVSELDQAPAMPNSQGVGTAVRFGPHGQVFGTAAQLTLALPQNVTHSSRRVGVYVYDPAGSWRRTAMVGVDLDNGLITGKAQHFSVYAAIQSSLDLDVTLARSSSTSSCVGALVGHSVVTSPLSEIELGSVNNLSDAVLALAGSGDPSVQDLLGIPGFSGSLRAVQVLDLIEAHGDTEVLRERQLTVTTLYVPGDGSATLTHSDALGNVLGVKHYAQPALELDDIAARLRGAASDATFAGETATELGLGVRVHLTYFPGDSSLDPVSVDDLGLAAVELAPSFTSLGDGSIADVDCDGLIEPYDSLDDSVMTTIDASPAALPGVFTGQSVNLSARLLRAATGVTGVWSLLDGDGGGALAEVPGAPDSRAFQASTSGRHLVSFRTQGGNALLEHVFAIDVVERVAGTPPSCNPSKELDTGRVGEAVALTAVVSDSDSPLAALSVEWGLIDTTSAAPLLTPASTLLARDTQALFSPLDAGNYTIGCRAFDGMSYGPVGSVPVSVVARAADRAPTDLVLSPMATIVPVGQSLTFHAYARDPDGDPLSFDWTVTGAVATGQPVTVGNESVLHVQFDTIGAVEIDVAVSDGNVPPVRITGDVQVTGTPPVTVVDADHDGWPAGPGPSADCDDSNPGIHPQAADLCGDNIDSDCDGEIAVSDCDGDMFTIAMGDCDDNDPKRYPRAAELCDGVDNDCNGQTDENFSLGKACTQGMGACANTGVLQCSSDGLASLCTASPLPQATEICDRIDNDCDGQTDEDGVCTVEPGTLDAGAPDDAGTSAPYDAGVVMIDTDAGTQPACQYSGPEVCTDGLDNDCDGAADLKDADCQAQGVVGDACSSVQELALDQTITGSLKDTSLDFTSRCTGKATADLVYSFTMPAAGIVQVQFEGPTTASWSIQSGTCDDKASKLVEQFCGSDTNAHDLVYGQYFLVLQGSPEPFRLSLTAVYK